MPIRDDSYFQYIPRFYDTLSSSSAYFCDPISDNIRYVHRHNIKLANLPCPIKNPPSQYVLLHI